MAMAMLKPVSRLFGAVRSVPGRIGFPVNVFKTDLARTCLAGAVLFGVAGAGLGAKGSMNAFGVQAAAAGATVRVDWGTEWAAWAVVGAFVGTLLGAGVSFLVRLKSSQRGLLLSLLVVGLLGGLSAGGAWGHTVARDRVFEMRAQPANTKPVPVPQGASFSVTNGPIRLSGSVARKLNYPVLAFMLAVGGLVGMLTARGLAYPSALRGVENAGTQNANSSNGAAPRQHRRAA